MDLGSLYRFNVALTEAPSLAACADLFRAEIAPFGFDTFACGEFDARDRGRNAFYIIDWPPAWRAFYIGSGLINRDPLLDALATRGTPFTWSDLRRDRAMDRAGTEALQRIAAEGWTEGLVVPLPGSHHRTGLVSLVGHEPLTPPGKEYLSLAGALLHRQARMLAAREGFPMPPAGLSEREIEALRCVSRGLTDRQIADELQIATSTAHEFVEKAKTKLNAGSRAELVAYAVALGVLDI